MSTITIYDNNSSDVVPTAANRRLAVSVPQLWLIGNPLS